MATSSFAVTNTFASGDVLTHTNLNTNFDDVETFVNRLDTFERRKIIIANWTADTADATTQSTFGSSFNVGGSGTMGAGLMTLVPLSSAGATEAIVGTKETDTFNYDNDVFFSGVMKLSAALDADLFACFGLSTTSTSGNINFGFRFGDDRASPDSKIYGVDGSGTVELTGITVTNFNHYVAVHRGGVGTTFYVNGVSKGTLAAGSILTGTAVAKVHAEITQLNSNPRTGTFQTGIGINKII